MSYSPSESPQSSELRVLEIFPNGDTVLHSKRNTGDECLLKVSSAILTAASPVFSSLFKWPGRATPEKSAEPSAEVRTIELEDDPWTLTRMMDILHFNNHAVPKNIVLGGLFDVATFCDKYDSAEAAWPWVQLWLNHLWRPEDGDGSHLEMWLLISYVFKLQEIFRTITRQLVLKTRLDSKGELVTHGNKTMPENVPPSWIDQIKLKRQTLVQSLLHAFETEMESYRRKILLDKPVCDMVEERDPKHCDIVQLGSLTKAYLQLDMMRSGSQIPEKRSASDIYQVIQDMENCGTLVKYRQWGVSRNESHHAVCGVKTRLLTKADSLFEDVKGFTLETNAYERGRKKRR